MKITRFLAGCAAAASLLAMAHAQSALDAAAETYVKLALAAGVHDGDYVDAYYGPAEWRTAAETAKVPLADVRAKVAALDADLARVNATGFDALTKHRHA